MSATGGKSFWSGKDTSGREVRAFFVTHAVNYISAATQFPCIVFRVRSEWECEPGWLQMRRESVASVNRSIAELAAQRGNKKPKQYRMPRAKGIVWNIACVVPLEEFARVRKFATTLGLEAKFRPNMARLFVPQLGEVAVALDAWMETGRAA